MQAGPEAARLIAEHIMGWSTATHRICEEHGLYVDDGVDFDPWTNIRDAWKVVERMAQGFGYLDGYRLELMQIIDRLKHGENAGKLIWRASFLGPTYGTENARTAPIAICLAALKAQDVHYPLPHQ